MLNLMRKHASSWIIKVLLFAIVVVFSFWGVGSFRDRRDTHVAEVNGEIVTHEVYRQSYNNLIDQYRRIYGSNLTDDMLAILQPREAALDNLIYRILSLQEARRLGMRVTEKELDAAIMAYPAFQVEGVFSPERANQVLALSRFSTGEFRQSYQEDLLINKLRALVLDGVSVSDEEARQWYAWQNAEVNIAYLLLSPDRHKDIVPDEQALKEHFEANREAYKTDLQVKASYLFFDPVSYKEQIAVADEEIENYYNANPAEFRSEKTVEARHILFKLDAEADEQTVNDQRAAADKVYALAKAGQDFAELAKTYSEGPTRDKGGFLGAFKRDTMVKPFADKAFSMDVGEISEPVRTQFGWHIIKVEKVNEAATRSLEEVRDTIRSKMVTEKARALALEQAESVYDTLFDGDALADAAKERNISAVTTEFFTLQNPPRDQGIRNPRQFAETAFGLETMAISDILDMDNGYYLLQVIERKEPEVPAFEAVADRVKADLVQNQQKTRAAEEAGQVLEQLKKGDALEDVAARFDLKVMETGFFKRSGSIPKIGYEPQIVQAAFQRTAAQPLAEEVIHGRQGAYVISLKERKAPDEEGFEKEKAAIKERLIGQKKQTAMQQWLEDLKRRSAIDINRKLIE